MKRGSPKRGHQYCYTLTENVTAIEKVEQIFFISFFL